MARHFKRMVYTMLAAKVGGFLRRRGHHSAANMIEHAIHRRSGHGYYGYGPHPGHHHGYHGHYRSHYGYHGHYKKRRRRYRW